MEQTINNQNQEITRINAFNATKAQKAPNTQPIRKLEITPKKQAKKSFWQSIGIEQVGK